MRSLVKLLCGAALGAGLLLTATARADGLAIAPSALGLEARAKLEQQILADRAAHPKAFDALKKVKGHRFEGYRNRRNPIPSAARELRGLGPSALLPMLEALAFQAPAREGASDAEWDALRADMLDAVGMLRDARAKAVLLAAFQASAQSPAVRSAAGRALGRLGGDAELALLTQHAVPGDPWLLPAIDGLGQMRRLPSAKHLTALLASTDDEQVAQAVADALGTLGSSWAWRALGPKAAATGLEVRKLCATALAPGYARSQGKARLAMGEAILMVDHPSTVELLREARGADVKAVDALIARVERQRQRARR